MREKSDFFRLIKNSTKTHTLIQDAFGFGLIICGFMDKYLARQMSRYMILRWCRKKFGNRVGKSKPAKQLSVEKNYVWVCWFQGMENAPKLVQECYKSICYWLRDREIVLITQDNYHKYTQIPEYIIDKWKRGIITNTHFSDILRLDLLVRHGGLWLDATTLMTGELPEYIDNEDFFVYRNGWMDEEPISIGSWLIFSGKTNNILLAETRALLYAYWKKYDYMIDYFLLHFLFRVVAEQFPEIWSRVPYFGQLDNHLMARELPEKYNFFQISTIKKITPIHKLTYKLSSCVEDCMLDHLHEIWH